MTAQQAYWNRVAAEKIFTHPLNETWLSRWVRPQARILDFGCGYGRTLDALAARGYTNTLGIDFSARMIARGRQHFPTLDLRVTEGTPIAEPTESFDVVLLFAVLTCIPGDREQEALMAELRRVLRPGGFLYVSDMKLQSDDRNRARYAAAVPRFGTHGVFETDDGAVVRHHDAARLAALLAGFTTIATDDVPLSTMNGNPAMAVQIFARREID
jgi:SAM-dependent methyltransferase